MDLPTTVFQCFSMKASLATRSMITLQTSAAFTNPVSLMMNKLWIIICVYLQRKQGECLTSTEWDSFKYRRDRAEECTAVPTVEHHSIGYFCRFKWSIGRRVSFRRVFCWTASDWPQPLLSLHRCSIRAAEIRTWWQVKKISISDIALINQSFVLIWLNANRNQSYRWQIMDCVATVDAWARSARSSPNWPSIFFPLSLSLLSCIETINLSVCAVYFFASEQKEISLSLTRFDILPLIGQTHCKYSDSLACVLDEQKNNNIEQGALFSAYG